MTGISNLPHKFFSAPQFNISPINESVLFFLITNNKYERGRYDLQFESDYILIFYKFLRDTPTNHFDNDEANVYIFVLFSNV